MRDRQLRCSRRGVDCYTIKRGLGLGFLSYVDDLEPLAEKLVGFVRQVERDSALGCGI